MLQDRKSEHGKFGSIRTAILTYGVQWVVDVVRLMANVVVPPTGLAPVEAPDHGPVQWAGVAVSVRIACPL